MKNDFEIDGFNNKYYFKDGKVHRDNDLPAVEYNDGTKAWYKNGLIHREAGPAYECFDGYKEWHLNGQRIFCIDNDEFLRLIKLKNFW